jgi:hypothetical protein
MTDLQIREALDGMALRVEVPSDLAGRTIAAVRALPPEQRRSFPRWAYVAAAGVAAMLLFVVGTFVTTRHRSSQQTRTTAHMSANALTGGGQNMSSAQSGTSQSGDAVAGQVAGANGAGRVVAPPPTIVGLKDLPQVVHNATISVQVRNFEKAWPKANDLATNDGGYVTNSNTSESGNRVGSGTLTIRVPSADLDKALSDLRALGMMTKLTTTGNDVSAPMADLNARKKNAEAEEAQLQNLLANAGNVSDVLDIRNRLNDNRNEIESIEGQIHSYQDKVDFATIDATIFDKSGSAPGGPVLGRGTLGRSIRTGGHIVLVILASAIVLLCGLIPLAALGVLGWFVLRKIRARAL